ncbi:phage major capsid protein [Phytomonospora endophytica]|uniref:HK97 family phage major capsid protein n=1 Tax=Phytomonospora endophytica TaxID=714109 RepID=A0A841FXR6_9ACTN|nr:phage major capsid protein [Phytomonospora endophytica]MBB6038332.1 HK97 family phage major capsid protein [Phytomonospora endophytica]GIG64262.1 hypothetical protein Pen01_05570 [Phytomonospora endophytica]
MNAVIARLQAERAAQVEFIDQLLSKVESDERDLVDAETSNLSAARERIAALDAQLAPLVEFEELRADSSATMTRAIGGATTSPRSAAPNAPAADGPVYRTAGEFVLDHLRAKGGAPHLGIPADAGAAERLERAARAVAKQTTAETPGILPEPIVGQVVNLIDTNRPLLTSLGIKPLGGIPGKSFSRPKITQHTTVGKQTAEKTEIPSQALKIDPIDFTKETYGGCVNVSRQDIDWSAPGVWDILISDLANIYGKTTESVAATAFGTGVTQTVAAADDTLKGWSAALYGAAATAYAGAGELPDRIWCSVDMWAAMGSVTDAARLSFGNTPAGSGDLSRFSGDVLALPRVVVPGLAEKSVIVGSSSMFEFYEQVIGLLSAVEPSLLGVEVAYGGYVSYGFLEAKAFCKVTPPAAKPDSAPSK